MRVLLVNPSTGYYTRAISTPLGLLSIATFLRNKGHIVKLLDRCIEYNRIKQTIKKFKPDIIGISLMSSRGLKDTEKISKVARKAGIPVWCGGYFPTMSPEMILNANLADIVICGEGEITFNELIAAYENRTPLNSINGIVYKDNLRIIKTPDRDFADLNNLPVLDWSLIKVKKYFQSFFHCEKMLYLYSSKGCPGKCTFCSNAFYNRSTFRKRPNSFVMQEIKTLVEDYGMDGVYFTGELWCANKNDAYDFCERVKNSQLRFTWGMLANVNQYDAEDLKTLSEAGCRHICFGIESGCPHILKGLKKNINLEKARETFDICDTLGITSVASFMIGLPGETEEDLLKTIDYIKSIKASIILIYLFTPIENTEIYNSLAEKNLFYAPKNQIENAEKYIAMEKPQYNFSEISTKELKVIKAYFDWKAFTDKKSLSKNKSHAFAFQTIVNGLKSISLKGPISFFVNGFRAFKEFCYVYYYAHMFKNILEKYGLR